MTDEPIGEIFPHLADLDTELGRRAQPDETACGDKGPGAARCQRRPHVVGRHAFLEGTGLVMWS